MIQFDLSLNTLVVSAVIAGVGYILKAAIWGLVEICRKLITTLIQTVAKVELLDGKMASLIQTVGDVQKNKQDLNALYSRLKHLETQLLKDLD